LDRKRARPLSYLRQKTKVERYIKQLDKMLDFIEEYQPSQGTLFKDVENAQGLFKSLLKTHYS